MNALTEEIKAAVREVVREEIRAALAGTVAPAASDDRDDPLIDVDAAASRLGLSTSTIYKLAGRGVLASIKLGSRLRFKPADLAAHVEARRCLRAHPAPALTPQGGRR